MKFKPNIKSILLIPGLILKISKREKLNLSKAWVRERQGKRKRKTFQMGV